MKTIVPTDAHLLPIEDQHRLHTAVVKRMYLTPLEQNPCWNITGWQDGKGFRKMRCRGRAAYVHRIMWEMAHKRAVPPGLILDHKCKNRSCCNPSHLEPVTVRVNTERGNGGWVYEQKKREYGHTTSVESRSSHDDNPTD